MGMGGGGGRDKLQSDINVTPLVDVCLVLLIIFMVVTPMLQKGVSVQIPQADNPDKKPESSKQKMISIQYTNPPAYYMDNPKQMSKAEFQNALDELYQRNPSAELVIKADQRLKYGDVKEVIKMTKDAGLPGRRPDRREEAKGRRAASPPRDQGDQSPWRWRVGGGAGNVQERHQHHAAGRRGAGAAHHLHGDHAAACRWATTSRCRRRRRPRSTSRPPADLLIVSLTPANKIYLNKEEVNAADPLAAPDRNPEEPGQQDHLLLGRRRLDLRRGHQGDGPRAATPAPRTSASSWRPFRSAPTPRLRRPLPSSRSPLRPTRFSPIPPASAGRLRAGPF